MSEVDISTEQCRAIEIMTNFHMIGHFYVTEAVVVASRKQYFTNFFKSYAILTEQSKIMDHVKNPYA
jgi:hypothetical protein